MYDSGILTSFSPCFLKGLSFHLGAVLLSLGFITYVEHGTDDSTLSYSFYWTNLSMIFEYSNVVGCNLWHPSYQF